ncbi:MAG: alpha/beta hydrolase [Chloroflexi bacterium]|nr:alpha/beta hydrolase [Chloroflexota bacterium]
MTHDDPRLTDPADLRLDERAVAEPDPAAEPSGFTVEVDPADRIHFLDWGAAVPGSVAPRNGVLAIHGLSQTAWTWAPVARRLAGERRVVAMDLRGHGLSDAPTHGYDERTLGGDVIAVAEGTGLLDDASVAGPTIPGLVVAGHGFGAIVAAWAARELGSRCRGLVLVDGGWEAIATTSGLEPEEFLGAIEEPPEVLRSLGAYLADRRSFDPPTWDADQDRAARSAVVELPAGRVVSSTRPHALAGSVEAMFAYRPLEVLGDVRVPIVALIAADPDGSREAELRDARRVRIAAGRSPIEVVRFPADAHNLLRYRPAAVAAAIRTFD